MVSWADLGRWVDLEYAGCFGEGFECVEVETGFAAGTVMGESLLQMRVEDHRGIAVLQNWNQQWVRTVEEVRKYAVAEGSWDPASHSSEAAAEKAAVAAEIGWLVDLVGHMAENT